MGLSLIALKGHWWRSTEHTVDRYASARLQRGRFPTAFRPTTVLHRGTGGMARVRWFQALLDCPRGAQVALYMAQKTVTLVTGRSGVLLVSHPDIRGGV